MEVRIKKTSWHARLFAQTYNVESLPSNLCPYFWGLVISLVLLPLTFWTLVFYKICPDEAPWRFGVGHRIRSGLVAWIVTVVVSLVGFAYVSEHYYPKSGVPYTDLVRVCLLALPFGILIVGGALLTVFLVCLLCMGICVLFKMASESVVTFISKPLMESEEPKNNNVLFAYLKARKQKYCPKIDWE